jgi:hypothetical protein
MLDNESRRRSPVKAVLSRVRPRLGFANVTSVLALFVALGGTGYAAAKLPVNSVDTPQIRTNGVGKSELRTAAVGKSEIRPKAVGKSEIATNGVGPSEVAKSAIDADELRDGGIALADLSTAARTSLTETGAVTFRAAVTSTGAAAGGNAKAVGRSAAGTYALDFGRDLSACQFGATLAAVQNGGAVEQPAAGMITAAADGTRVIVKAFKADGTALDAPFHLLVAC